MTSTDPLPLSPDPFFCIVCGALLLEERQFCAHCEPAWVPPGSLTAVYADRNLVVQAFASAMEGLDWPVAWGVDEAEPDWPVLYIETSAGQVSWHIPKAERIYEPEDRSGSFGPMVWDGHTDEVKFGRLRDALGESPASLRIDRARRHEVARDVLSRDAAKIHEPSGPHRYRIICEDCGEPGFLHVSLEPATHVHRPEYPSRCEGCEHLAADLVGRMPPGLRADAASA